MVINFFNSVNLRNKALNYVIAIKGSKLLINYVSYDEGWCIDG